MCSSERSFGHLIGASDLRMLYECWLQLRGEAGKRQIASVSRGRNLALTHNLGGAPSECVRGTLYLLPTLRACGPLRLRSCCFSPSAQRHEMDLDPMVECCADPLEHPERMPSVIGVL